MSKLTDKFKSVAIKVANSEESVEVQKALFALGYRDHSGVRRRHVRGYNQEHYVITNEICIVAYGFSSHYPTLNWGGEVVPQDELFAAVVEHKQAKRDAKKASRKRKQLRKQGWTIYDGSGCPEEVKGKPGKILVAGNWAHRTNIGMTPTLDGYDWSIEGVKGDIIAYMIDKEGQVEAVTSRLKELGYLANGPIKAPVGDVNSDARGSGARYNEGKPDFSLIPLSTMEGEARVWAYGANKYKAWNWMKGMDWSVPYACMMRHMAAWQRGEEVDPETGESHLDHAMCNLRMLRYYTDFYKEGDNRPKDFFKGNDGLE